MAYMVLACRGLAGGVFVASAFSKVRSGSAFRVFRSWLGGLPVPVARNWPGVLAVAMVVAEAAIVVLVALPWTARAGLVLAAVMLAVFTAGTWLAVARGAGEPCQCFGASSSPLAWRHVVRDALLCAAASAGAAGAAGAAGGAAPLSGMAASVAAGLAAALFAVFLDDLAALFGATTNTAPRLAPGDDQ